MDLETFRRQVLDPRRTEDELKRLRVNAIEERDSECARVAEDELSRRFPFWRRIKRKAAVRSKLTTARFNDEEHEFPSSKDAYVWLLERFITAKPALFFTPNWETDFVALGRARNYFDRDPRGMFHQSPHLGDDENNYRRLSNGWYANVNLSNDRKFDVLARFAAVAKLQWESEWYWEVLQ